LAERLPTVHSHHKSHPEHARAPDLNLLLRPGQEHDLAIIDGPLKDEDVRGNISRRVCFCIYWSKNSSTWLPQLPVFIFTSIASIQRIAAATSQ
jgi:hypothetical protein